MDNFVKIPKEKLDDVDKFTSWVKEEVENISDSISDSDDLDDSDDSESSSDSLTEEERKEFILLLKHRTEQVIVDQTVESVFKYGNQGKIAEIVNLEIYAAKLNYGEFIGFVIKVDKPLPSCRPEPHPFKLFDKDDIATTVDGRLEFGQIISYNDTMVSLLKDLVLPDDELSTKYSDNHPLETRARIIYGLGLFWD
jgi:hypothetical protein